MPVYHAGPFTGDEFAESCRRSGVSGMHVGLNSGLAWCRLRCGWLWGLAVWLRLGLPGTAREAKELLRGMR